MMHPGLSGRPVAETIARIVKPWSEAANWLAVKVAEEEDFSAEASDLQSVEGEYCAKLNAGTLKKKKKVTPRGPIKKLSLAMKTAAKKKPGSK